MTVRGPAERDTDHDVAVDPAGATVSQRLPAQSDLDRACELLTTHLGASVDPGHTVRGTAAGFRPIQGGASVMLRPITLRDADATEVGGPSPDVDYEVIKVLGSGGMGVVHLAWQPTLRREVAIKTTYPDVVQGVEAAALTAEAVVTGGLEHPNIVPIHALGRLPDGRPVLVMKRVAGVSWANLLDDANHPAWARQPADRLAFHVNVLMQVSNALHFAHAQGVIHRDLKAENVMVGEFGEVYLLDWGIALRLREVSRSTDSMDPSLPPGMPDLVGTPAYMAPEMLLGSGAHITPRTDVYLLGATLHRVLTGTSRHEGHNLFAVLGRAAASNPVTYPPTVPRELAAICNRATFREPAGRFPSAKAFRVALEGFLQHRSSRQLVEQAALRSEVLQGLLDGPAARTPGSADAVQARQVYAECRFGLQQALRAWPQNPDAANTLAGLTRRMCTLELDQRNLAGLDALITELPEVPDELVARRDALRVALDEERAGLARLRNLEHDLDERVAYRQRLIGTLLSGVVNTGVMGTFAVLDQLHQLSLDYTTVYVVLVFLSVVATVLYLPFHREFTRTRFNRDLLATLPVAVAAVFIATAFSQLMGLPPRGAVLTVAISMGLIQTTIGALTIRPFLAGGIGYLVAVLVGAAVPALAITAVTLSVAFSHGYMALRWARMRATAAATPAAPG